MRQNLVSKAMIGGVTTALAVGLGLVSSARGDVDVAYDFDMPAHASATVSSSGCLNHPGPNITIAGAISLGGLKGNLIFENNLKGTHQVTVVGAVTNVLVEFGTPLQVPKQPSKSCCDNICTGQGVGGNPYIFMRFEDGKGDGLTDWFFLGRCVQGFVGNAAACLPLRLTHARHHIASGGCQNSGGPYITLSGDLTFHGMKADVLFVNNPNAALPGQHEAVCNGITVDIVLEGTALTLPKSPASGGVGGNPLILFQPLGRKCNSDSDSAIQGAILLGRCNKL